LRIIENFDSAKNPPNVYIICDVDSTGARPAALNENRPKGEDHCPQEQAHSYVLTMSLMGLIADDVKSRFPDAIPDDAARQAFIQDHYKQYGGYYIHLCQSALQLPGLADTTTKLQNKGNNLGDGLGCYSENLASSLLHELMHVVTFDTSQISGRRLYLLSVYSEFTYHTNITFRRRCQYYCRFCAHRRTVFRANWNSIAQCGDIYPLCSR
jgi:hypothetical protein